MKMGAPGGHDRVQCIPRAQGGLEASTRYRVLLDTEGAGQGGVSLVALWPLQGRTHQLRVHCAEKLGAGKDGGPCYILGDYKYGPWHQDLSSPYLEAEGDASPAAAATWHGSEDAGGEDGHDVLRTRSHVRQRHPKLRLCLHALRISVRLGPHKDWGARPGSERSEISCIAHVPEHFMAAAERFGLSRQSVLRSLEQATGADCEK
jgi:23S rRNA-/tRNA-specific pseudouridylate synthase